MFVFRKICSFAVYKRPLRDQVPDPRKLPVPRNATSYDPQKESITFNIFEDEFKTINIATNYYINVKDFIACAEDKYLSCYSHKFVMKIVNKE